jgi:hypothetical protein
MAKQTRSGASSTTLIMLSSAKQRAFCWKVGSRLISHSYAENRQALWKPRRGRV